MEELPDTAAGRIVARTRASIPPDVLHRGGRALYSPASTLSGASRFYFLGLNPREAPRAGQPHSQISIDDDLSRLAHEKIFEHAYLDEAWKDYPPGQAPIQLRGKMLFAVLAGGEAQGEALLRATPVSNFVLERSEDVATLEKRHGRKAHELASDFWPFHEALIEETSAEVLLTHALSIVRPFARSMGWGAGLERPSGWGGTLRSCYSWRLPAGRLLLAIPSLSRYIPDGSRIPALTAFIEEFLAEPGP
ncbi:MAG: hypothetical protein V2J02_12070 [Pseudomonadales bacterium]|nr:hypothetical protein [Pseudomonadales bacterium]